MFKFCRENCFCQLVKEPTHKAGHLLDLGLTDMVEIERVKVFRKLQIITLFDSSCICLYSHMCNGAAEFMSTNKFLVYAFVKILQIGIGHGYAALTSIMRPTGLRMKDYR